MPDADATATLAATATTADTPRPLPDGWRWLTLAESVGRNGLIVDGDWVESKDQDPNGDVRLIQLADVGDGNYRDRSARFLTSAKAAELHCTYLVPGDVLVARMPDPLGRACIFPGDTKPAVTVVDVCVLRTDQSEITPDWLVFAINLPTTRAQIASRQSGATRMRVSRANLSTIYLPVPPLAEQRRIAAILAERMAAVERARAAAVAQLAAAKALPAAELRAVFQSEEAQAWPVVSLGDVSEIASGVTLGRRLEGQNTHAVPYLRVANVKDGYLDLEDVLSTDATQSEIDKLLLRWGDVLLTEGGDPDKLGRGTYWRNELDECIHQNHIFRVRFDLSAVLPSFVSAQIGSPYGKAYFLAHAKQTTGIATINQAVLRAFPLMLPSLSEQQCIAAELDARMGEIARLRASLEGQLDAINALPAALLRQAFNGEL